MELEFDPDSVFTAGTRIRDAATEVHECVTAPLRRLSLPQMPPSVRGEVERTLSRVVAIVSDAQRALIQVGRDMRNKTYEIASVDDAPELPWWTAPGKGVVTAAERFGIGGDDATRLPWWTVPGDIMVAGAQFTGLDVIYHYNEAKSGRASANDVKESGINFAMMLVGGRLVKGAWKGGKRLLGFRGGAKGGSAAGKAATTHFAAQFAVDRSSQFAAARAFDPRIAARLERIAQTNGRGIDSFVAEHIVGNSRFAVPRGATRLHTAGAWRNGRVYEIAAKSNSETIEMTNPGSRLQSITRGSGNNVLDALPEELHKAHWDNLSRRFVQQASGPIRASFEGAVRADSTFARVEIPELLRNTRVPSLTVTHVAGNTAGHRWVLKVSRSDPAASKKILQAVQRAGRLGGTVRITFTP